MEKIERINIIEFDDTEVTAEEELQQRYTIQDLDGCNWAFRKLSGIKIQEDEINELAKAEIERINKWKEEELKKNEDSKAFFEGLLTEYFITQKQVDPKFKISTPYGKVSSRKQQPNYEYDNDKFIEWAEENEYEDLLRIKKEPEKKVVKETFSINGNKLIHPDTGEIVEGVTITERADSINVKVE